MKARFSDSLQFFMAILLTGSLVYGSGPQQTVKAAEPEHSIVQNIEESKKAPVASVEAPVAPATPKVVETPVPAPKAVVAPQKAVEPAPVPTSNNETIVWNYLTESGFTRNQRAGIMGNLKQEHNFQTSGDGLAQWNGSRRTKLMNDPNWQALDTQLKFLMRELKGPYIGVYNQIKATEDVATIVAIFQDQFEKCDFRYCMQAQRTAYAQDILARH
jgi:hypothetical protein